MSTGYIIRDTVTGERFRAGSGKDIWSTQGGAKVAWRHSSWTLHRLLQIDTTCTWRWDPGSFNDQSRFVIEELTSGKTEAQLEEAKELLFYAQEMLDSVHCYDTDLYNDIRKFLGMDQ